MTSNSAATPTNPPLERARAIAPILEARARQAENERTLPPESVEAIADAGLLRLCLPRELGGDEPDFETVIEVWEELARADGSAGWTAMANGSAAGAAGAYLGDDAVCKIFGDDPAATVGGQFAPRGTGVAEAGGIRVSGSFSFGSGTVHSGYVSAGFIPLEDGQPRMADNGLPEMRVAFMPRDQIEFTDGWFVMGLRGTGSYDYEVRNVLVPDDFSFPLFTHEPRRGGAMMRMGMMPLTASGHAAWALGVGRRALDEVAALAGTKQRLGHPTALVARPTFQRDYAHAEARLRAARAFVMESFGDALASAERGDEVSLEERALLRMATCLATDAAREACDFAHGAAGTDSIRDGSPLHRAFLDIHTGSQHAFINEKVYTDCAEVLLGSVEDVIGL